ncbi:MAG: GMC family oxidoreductase [Pseudomonadales bacterium]|nr:GMC family oxidoreductase [Pseudomonadales bacterium]
MLLDLKDIAQDAHLTADVCIVGAGAAGLTLTRALSRSGLKVCLLESGGLDHETAITDLGVGANTGMPYYDLVDARLRFFGGTTNIWGGRCVTLDEDDFAARSWVPHSGWPISRTDLAAGYQRAAAALELGPLIDMETAWQRMGDRPPEFEDLASSFWYFDQTAERFSSSRCRDLFDNPQVQIITHATVTRLAAADNAGGINRIDFCGLDGKRATLTARAYVLAAGGIENPRLLLASRDIEASGIGNGRDQVGRCFMEHPHGRLGRIESAQAFDIWRWFTKRYPAGSVPLAPVLRPSPAHQARAGILNTAITFKLQRDPAMGVAVNKRAYQTLKHQLSPTRTNRTLWHLYNRMRRFYQRHREPLIRRRARSEERHLYAMIRGEQAPNPDSRVQLSRDVDALGQPRAVLNWQFTDLDKHTLKTLATTLDKALRSQNLGSFSVEPWVLEPDRQWPVDPTIGNHPIAGYHHIGTTRMSGDPRSGVVDADCRVFGYANLYIAGSSVFSTAGWANPTMTILALSFRLADHLQAELC